MSRKRTSVNEDAIELLRHFVKSKANLSCETFAQVKTLYDLIQHTTGEVVSVQTLSRFFGVVKSDFNPSIHTLNTLSRYLGHDSFRSFESINQEGGPKNEMSGVIFDLFFSMFSEINHGSNQKIHELTRNVHKWMNKNPNYVTDVYSALAKTGTGRKLFFEDFVYVDALNNGFGNGLNYYILHADNNEQKFYGYTLNCYRFFVTGETQKFREYFELIRQFKQSEIASFHPIVVDRYYAAVLFNYFLSPEEKAHEFEQEMIDFDILTSTSIITAHFGYHVAEAFVLTGEFQRAWEILHNNHAMNNHVPDCLKMDFDIQLRIWKLICGICTNNYSKRRCLADFLELQNRPLPILSEKYFAFFLLSIKYKLFTRLNIRRQVKESIDLLVETTGFRYLDTFHGKVLNCDV